MSYCFSTLMLLIIISPFKSYGSTSPLNDIFNTLKTKAIEKNFDLQKIKEESKQKDSAEYTSFTKNLPSLQAKLSREYNPDERDIRGQDQSQLILELNYDLYNPRYFIRHNISKAELELLKNEEKIIEKEVHINLKDLLGRYFVQVVKVNYFLRSISRATTNYKFIQKGNKLGRNSKLDVLRSKANLDLLLSQLNQEIQFKHDSRERILNYTALNTVEFEEFKISKILETDKEIVTKIDNFTNIDNLLRSYEKHRDQIINPQKEFNVIGPKFIKYQLQENVESHRAENFREGNWPTVNLKATFTNESDSLSNLVGNKSVNQFVVGAYLTVPLFSFGSSFSSSNEMQSAKSIAKIERARGETELKNSILKDIKIVNNLRNAIKTQTQLVNQNQEISRLSLISYKLKKSDLQDLLTSENNLLNSKAKLIEDKIRLSSILRRFLYKLGDGEVE